MVDTVRPSAPVSHANESDHRRQLATVINKINHSTPDYSQTQAEINAGVTPTNFKYEPGNALRYGATGDGSTDNATALQNWLDCGEANLVLPSGTYMVGATITLAETSSVGRIQGLGMPVIKRKDDTGTSSILTISDENELEIDGIIFDGNQTGIAPVSDPTSFVDLAVIATLTASPNTSVQTEFFVTISNCQFRDAPGSCVSGAGMQSTLITGCRFEEWLDHAVYASGDSGTSRGLGGNVVVDGNMFLHTGATHNGACKAQNNVKKFVVSNNTVEIGTDSFLQLGGSDFLPLEIVVIGNTGQCSHFAEISTATGASQDTESQMLFADNNMSCSDRAFYLGDTASNEFAGHLQILGGTFRNTSGSFKAFLDLRFIDNATLETSIIAEGVKLVDFSMHQGKWAKKTIIRNNICDRTYAAWFNYVSEDDSEEKIIVIEGNQFLDPAASQGRCDFAISDASTLIIRGNTYRGDGIACQLRDFPKYVLLEANTCMDCAGVFFGSSVTARSSADGVMILKDNKMISTTGASANARLVDENTSSGTVLLDSYNVFAVENFFNDSTSGIRCIGTAVTGFSGSTIFYTHKNYGLNSSFDIQYPTANRSSFLPFLQGVQEYSISNEATDRTYDANSTTVAELADVVATLLKDMGHGA